MGCSPWLLATLKTAFPGHARFLSLATGGPSVIPERPGRRGRAAPPCFGSGSLPEQNGNTERNPEMSSRDLHRRQPTCGPAPPNAAAAAASASPAAPRPGSRSIVSAGPGSGDTEGDRRKAPQCSHASAEAPTGPPRLLGPHTQPTLLAKARPNYRRGVGPSPLPPARGRGHRRYRPTCWAPKWLRGGLCHAVWGGVPAHRFLSW